MFYKGKKVLVTGGSGMIGSALCEQLLELGAEVTVMDTRQPQVGNVEWVRDACSVPLNCERRFRGQDIIFNLAAKVAGVGYNADHNLVMFAENIDEQIAPVIVASILRIPHFLQVSSVCVYSERAQSFGCFEDIGIDGSPNEANGGYAWAKRMGERAVRWSNLPHAVIVRPANTYGERDHFEADIAHVIPALIRKAFEEEKIEVMGTGGEIREFVHVADTARGMLTAMELGDDKAAYNIGGNGEMRVTIAELANLIREHVGKTHKEIIFDGEGRGDWERWVRSEKLQALGWKPQVTLADGLRRTIEWYRNVR